MIKFEQLQKKLHENKVSLKEDFSEAGYTYLAESKLIESIEKNHQVKITTSLVESYKNILKNNTFTIDPVLLEVKNYDNFGKYTFKLNDGSLISLSEDTYFDICKILSNKYVVVEYMNESLDNFKEVLKKIRE